MPILSIIVPVYNVEVYLSRCINSILSQTLTDFEAIFIDDGSPDRCGEILNEYAARDRRLVIIHQRNQGVSAARNAGLNVAHGEYIGFVDPDDWIELDMFETLITAMEWEDVDLACCAWADNYADGTRHVRPQRLPSQVMNREKFAQCFTDMPPRVATSVTNKLFRKSMINCQFDSQYTICEDTVFLAHYILGINKAAWVDKPLYHIYHRQSSATRRQPRCVVYGAPARRQVIDIMDQIRPICRMKAENLYLNHCMAYITADGPRDDYYAFGRHEFVSYVRQNYISILRNRDITTGGKYSIIKRYWQLIREKDT